MTFNNFKLFKFSNGLLYLSNIVSHMFYFFINKTYTVVNIVAGIRLYCFNSFSYPTGQVDYKGCKGYYNYNE